MLAGTRFFKRVKPWLQSSMWNQVESGRIGYPPVPPKTTTVLYTLLGNPWFHYSERFPLYRFAKCDVIGTMCDKISNNTSQILRYKLRQIFFTIFLKSYSQTFPEITFTCIFLTQKIGFRPDLVCFRMSRPRQGYVRPTSVVNDDFTMQQC